MPVFAELDVSVQYESNGADKAIRDYDAVAAAAEKAKRSISQNITNNKNLMSPEYQSIHDSIMSGTYDLSKATNDGVNGLSRMTSLGADLSAELTAASASFTGLYSNMSFEAQKKERDRLIKDINTMTQSANVFAMAFNKGVETQKDSIDAQARASEDRVAILKEQLEQLQSKAGKINLGDARSWITGLKQARDDVSRLTKEFQEWDAALSQAKSNGAPAEGVQAISTKWAEVNKQLLEAQARQKMYTDLTEKLPESTTEYLKLQEAINKSLEEERNLQDKLKKQYVRLEDNSSLENNKSWNTRMTNLEMTKVRLAALEQQMSVTKWSLTEFGKRLKDVFGQPIKAGWASGLSTAKKEFGFISKHLTGIKKSIIDWRSNQKSIGDQAKELYGTFTNLWNMFKTRTKRKLIGIAFEDVTSYIGRIAGISPRFNTAMSGFIVSLKTLGAQVVAILEPLASFALPYLAKFIDLLTAGANAAAQFAARITGSDWFIKASKGQYDFATAMDKTSSNTKKATKSAKEYKNTVLSFDQLHKLNDNDDNSDPLGINAVDFQKAEAKSNAFNDIAERIWDAFNIGDFRGAGRAIGDGINASFSWLKNLAGWEANGDKITSWITNFGEIVKGVFESFDPHIVGDAIGDVINTGIESFLLLTDPNIIPYQEIGSAIGQTLGWAVKTINWEDLGKGLVQGLQAAIKFMNGLIYASVMNDTTGEFESVFKLLGNAVSDLFKGVVDTFNVEDWSNLLSGLTNGFFEFLSNALSDQEKIRSFGTKIGETITRAFRNINADTVASGINALADTIINLFDGLLDGLSGKAIFDKLKAIFEKVDKAKLIKAIGIALAPALISGVLGGLKTAIKAIPALGIKVLGKLFSGAGKIGKLISGLFAGTGKIGKWFSKFGKAKQLTNTATEVSKSAEAVTSIGKTFKTSLAKIGTNFVAATAFIAIIAEIGLVLKEYVGVVKDIASIDIGEDFSSKLKPVLALAGTATLVAGIITAITTAVSKSGIGSMNMLSGELLAGGFLLELMLAAEAIRSYASVVSDIASITISDDYNSKLDKVLQLALGSTVLVGILTAIGTLVAGSGVGAVAMAAGELLAAGILVELQAMSEIIRGYVVTVQDIANLQIDEGKYVTNIQAIQAAVLAFTELMLSESWTALFQLPGQIATALDLTLINEAVDTIKQLTDIQLPDSGKITSFQQTAESLLNMFSDDSGFVQSLIDGFTGLASNWSGSVDMTGVKSKFDTMVYMIDALAGLSGKGTSTSTIQGSWATAMSAVEETTITSMGNIAQIVTDGLNNVRQLFNDSKFGLAFSVSSSESGVAVYGESSTASTDTLKESFPEWFLSKSMTSLSEMDGVAFTTALTDQVAEKTALPATSLAAVDNATFKEEMAESMYTSFLRALVETKDDDTGDTIIIIDGDEVARAVNRSNRNTNKRTNPLVGYGSGIV